ncbi:MAG: PLD nuclease N-terminal domain-containing protein [Desulfobacteraceae bacterium]|nr:PLD nuclease N-terminal domain-containing protein [Desulfobacteraceae bacterium]
MLERLIILAVALIIPMIPTFWAILDIPKRRFARLRYKIIWFAVVSTLPVLGAILYLCLGRRHTQPATSIPCKEETTANA